MDGLEVSLHSWLARPLPISITSPFQIFINLVNLCYVLDSS